MHRIKYRNIYQLLAKHTHCIYFWLIPHNIFSGYRLLLRGERIRKLRVGKLWGLGGEEGGRFGLIAREFK